MYGAGWEAAVADLNTAVLPHLFVSRGPAKFCARGPWGRGGGYNTGVLASGDPIATDVVALGLIKTIGRWDQVTTKGVWEQVQIQRAIALGLGAHGPHEVDLVSDDLTERSKDFATLPANIRRHVGLV